MKIFKNTLMLFAMLSGIMITGCSEDTAEYTPGENGAGIQAYFPSTNALNIELTSEDNTFTIPVERVDSSKAATLPLLVEGEDIEVYTFPESVTFEEAQKTAFITVNVDTENQNYDDFKTITLTLDDKDNTTPYGNSSYTFTIGMPAPWTPWTSTKKDWVAAGYDAEEWPLSEDSSTCTYTYKHIFSGDDTELPISYRLNLLDPEAAQIKIDNWCSDGVSLVLDYNPQTKQIRIPMQTSGYIDDSLGEFFITDVSGWQGKDYTASYPCYYDPETGLIVLNSAWVLADMSCYGYGVETIQLDGFYIPDYSVDAEYLGIFTSPEQKPFAQINVKSIGVDAEKAVALIVTAEDDAAAVADALAAGEVTGTDVVAGYNNIAIEEGMTGELQVVICSVLEGAAMGVKSFKFEYYGGGNNPWVSLGMGLYTDAIVSDMYGIPAETYEVEIKENTETPGIYRIMNPYGEKWSYAAANTQTPSSYLEINAENPNAVYILPQMLGVNMEGGDTELGFASCAGYFYATGQASLEELTSMGYMGKVIDGIINLPTFEKGTPGDENYYTYQGVVYYGSSKAYNAANGFKVVLPDAVTATDLAKARKYTRRSVNFNRVHAHEMPNKYVKPLTLKMF